MLPSPTESTSDKDIDMDNNEYRARIKSKTYLNTDTILFELSCPEIASLAKPGQFVNVSCGKFLKRPFGIAGADKDDGDNKPMFFKIEIDFLEKTKHGCPKGARMMMVLIYF